MCMMLMCVVAGVGDGVVVGVGVAGVGVVAVVDERDTLPPRRLSVGHKGGTARGRCGGTAQPSKTRRVR